MRLHIIGVPSAGKTTLGKGISRLLRVPYHDLDSVAFVDDRWTLRPPGERDAMVARILEQPGFVTEGGFLGWTESLLADRHDPTDPIAVNDLLHVYESSMGGPRTKVAAVRN